MLKTDILNRELIYNLDKLGHTDRFCICDAGFPLPDNVVVIDLALFPGTISFVDALHLIMDNVFIQKMIFAKEVNLNKKLTSYIDEFDMPNVIEYITHDDLKKEMVKCKFIIRTGECVWYSNVIIEAGVSF